MSFPKAGGYDIIGDVHGHLDKLLDLLDVLGYSQRGGVWAHSDRTAIFVGDLMDRGSHQVETIQLVRAMIDQGSALGVLGNHEFNAVAWHTPDPASNGESLRPHTSKNTAQHSEFIRQVGSGSELHDDLIAWFMTLPLWLDLDGLRIVHACWDPQSIAALGEVVSNTNSLTPELVELASREGSAEWQAIEFLLKGPEIPVEPGYFDKGGHPRHRARLRWWSPKSDRLRFAANFPEGTLTLSGDPYPQLPDVAIEAPSAPYRDDIPVFFGHYWRIGTPTVTSDHTACIDYSAGRDGPLVAYRWSGESVLSNGNFVASTDER